MDLIDNIFQILIAEVTGCEEVKGVHRLDNKGVHCVVDSGKSLFNKGRSGTTAFVDTSICFHYGI